MGVSIRIHVFDKTSCSIIFEMDQFWEGKAGYFGTLLHFGCPNLVHPIKTKRKHIIWVTAKKLSSKLIFIDSPDVHQIWRWSDIDFESFFNEMAHCLHSFKLLCVLSAWKLGYFGAVHRIKSKMKPIKITNRALNRQSCSWFQKHNSFRFWGF